MTILTEAHVGTDALSCLPSTAIRLDSDRLNSGPTYITNHKKEQNDDNSTAHD